MSYERNPELNERIWRSHSGREGDLEDYRLLGCDAVQSSVSSTLKMQAKHSFWTSIYKCLRDYTASYGRQSNLSDFVHRPDSKELEDKNTTFRKVDLFPSSGEGRHLLLLGPLERAGPVIEVSSF
jgi:hypothetical protein